MELDEIGRWWIGPNGERLRVIAGGDGPVVQDPPVEDPPVDIPPVEVPSTPTAEEEATRLREENARLRGENTALRETRREVSAPTPPAPPADPHAAELEAIEHQFAAGQISEAVRTVRLGALGAKTTLDRHAAETRETALRQRSGQRVAAYLARIPGLNDASGAEMAKVIPHLREVVEEFGLDATDLRAQALALERTFGPLDRRPPVDTREFERRRHPAGGGGGGTFGEEPAAPAKPKSTGERLFENLLPEFQQFYLTTRGSKEAAIKTLEFADEHQMRKQGRFK